MELSNLDGRVGNLYYKTTELYIYIFIKLNQLNKSSVQFLNNAHRYLYVNKKIMKQIYIEVHLKHFRPLQGYLSVARTTYWLTQGQKFHF